MIKRIKNTVKKILTKYKKEVRYNMEITGVENLNQKDLIKIMADLQDMGYEPHLKGRGDGQVSVKIPEKTFAEEIQKVSEAEKESEQKEDATKETM